MKRKNQSGEVVTAAILLSWFVLGLFGAAGHKVVSDLQQEQDRARSRYSIRVDYSGGQTLGVCEEPAR